MRAIPKSVTLTESVARSHRTLVGAKSPWSRQRRLTDRESLGLGQRFDAGVEPALIAGSAILSDDALRDHSVDLGHGRLETGLCGVLVTFLHGEQDLSESRTQPRAQRHVVGAAPHVLSGTLFR